MGKNTFKNAGKEAETISVQISYQILKHFSEGLYVSPHKAVEELVSNAYDAGAKNAHVILSDDLRDSGATIVVVDDGEGMNIPGLRQHWLIGSSMRRKKGCGKGLARVPIGKFGIGKLSTYVLASEFTHVSKFGSAYYATTMDYARVVRDGDATGIGGTPFPMPVRKLDEEQAQSAVQPWIEGDGDGYEALRLFGKDARPSWTVSILSDLKPKGQGVKHGILRNVLAAAMPRRGDFNLFLNGAYIGAPDIKQTPIGVFVLGKDLCAKDVQRSGGFKELKNWDNPDEPKESKHRHGFDDLAGLGRITGRCEIYDAPIGAHQGFFVYVRGRQINVGDEGFGIPRRSLRHGTFTRFRMEVHIDNLDEDITSSRESLREGDLFAAAQAFMIACFNYARSKLDEHDQKKAKGYSTANSVSGAPGSITRGPLLSLARKAAAGKVEPFYLRYPRDLTGEKHAEFMAALGNSKDKDILEAVEFRQLGAEKGVAMFDVGERKLLINDSHPFINGYHGFLDNAVHSHPLELMMMAEILMEAYLHHTNVDAGIIHRAIKWRDDMLRILAISPSSRRTPDMTALALIEAKNRPQDLEAELCAVFRALGFSYVLAFGGANQPDGTAEAILAAQEPGVSRSYKVCLEAKSGPTPVGVDRLRVSGMLRHMKKHKCQHGLVVGNNFATAAAGNAAIVQEIKQHCSKGSGETITLMLVDDLAKLLRVVAAKRVGGLAKIRELFEGCITPEESRRWVKSLESVEEQSFPEVEVLRAIWKCAKENPLEVVEYAAVANELKHCAPPVRVAKQDLVEYCRGLYHQTGGDVFANENSVGLEEHPDLIWQKLGRKVKVDKGKK